MMVNPFGWNWSNELVFFSSFITDFDERGKRVDVGVVLKNYIDECLKEKASNG